MSFFRDQLENWLQQLSVKADKVLDVGGSDKPVKGRTAEWQVKDYRILDLETPHSGSRPDICQDLNRNLEAVHDFHKDPPEKLAGLFDVVFCLEVMEYIYNPVQAIKNLYTFVKPGGTLYISFPFVYPMHKPIGADMLRYTEDGAIKLLEVAGFTVTEVRPRVHKSPDLLRAMYSADGMHTRHDDTVPHTGYLITAKRP